MINPGQQPLDSWAAPSRIVKESREFAAQPRTGDPGHRTPRSIQSPLSAAVCEPDGFQGRDQASRAWGAFGHTAPADRRGADVRPRLVMADRTHLRWEKGQQEPGQALHRRVCDGRTGNHGKPPVSN